MSYEVRWLQAPRIVLIRVWDELLLAEIWHGSAEVVQLFEAGTPPVHVVVDVTCMTDYPLSVSSINQAGPFFRHANIGCLTIYGIQSPAVRLILLLLSQMSSFELGIVDSFDAAIAFLRERDMTLPAEIAGLNAL